MSRQNLIICDYCCLQLLCVCSVYACAVEWKLSTSRIWFGLWEPEDFPWNISALIHLLIKCGLWSTTLLYYKVAFTNFTSCLCEDAPGVRMVTMIIFVCFYLRIRIINSRDDETDLMSRNILLLSPRYRIVVIVGSPILTIHLRRVMSLAAIMNSITNSIKDRILRQSQAYQR